MEKQNTIDFKGIIQTFLDKNEKTVFIPCDDDYNNCQRDSARRHWQKVAEELGAYSQTLKLWNEIRICGMHYRPITGSKESSCPSGYGSDLECDYEDNEDFTSCFADDELKMCKMKTIVIFTKEGIEKIKGLNDRQIKDYLVAEGLVEVKNNRFCLIDTY